MAHSLKLEVVAEGAEEQSQVDFLRGHACEVLQGYFFDRPMTVKDVSELLRQEHIKWNSAVTDAKPDSTRKPDLPLH